MDEEQDHIPIIQLWTKPGSPFRLIVCCKNCGAWTRAWEGESRAYKAEGWLECQREEQGIRVSEKDT